MCVAPKMRWCAMKTFFKCYVILNSWPIGETHLHEKPETKNDFNDHFFCRQFIIYRKYCVQTNTTHTTWSTDENGLMCFFFRFSAQNLAHSILKVSVLSLAKSDLTKNWLKQNDYNFDLIIASHRFTGPGNNIRPCCVPYVNAIFFFYSN